MAQDSIFGYVPTPAPARPQVAYGPGGMAPPVVPSPAMGYTPPAAPAAPPPPVVVGAPAAAATTPATPSPWQGAGYIAAAGAQAGSPAAAAYDTKSGVASALGAGASGAASGALIGSVVPGIGTATGALAGGAIGLITGGLNAWLSVGAKNKAERDQNRLLREAEAKQAKRDKIARDDALSQQAYDRKQVELQKRWAKNLQVREAIKGLVADETAGRDRYVATGRV